MPTGFPWAFFLSCTQESSRPGLGFLGCKSAEDCKTILFFLILAIFCESHLGGRKRRVAVPREAKLQKIANFMFLLLLPIFCNLCHFSICRTKTIFQSSIYQEPFGVVGQRGVARHLRRRCLAQSATIK